jgi:hypothetical protein
MKAKLPKRMHDVRVVITKTVFTEWARRFWLRKGTVMEGWLDKHGNFQSRKFTIYPTHFKVLGKFYFRKARA